VSEERLDLALLRVFSHSHGSPRVEFWGDQAVVWGPGNRGTARRSRALRGTALLGFSAQPTTSPKTPVAIMAEAIMRRRRWPSASSLLPK